MVDQYEKVDDEVKERAICYAANCDQPTSHDSLGFAPYVEAIKEFLTNPDTKPPLTLSIEGSWGSGKSSFMLQLRKKLEEKGAHTVQFDAWRHDKEDTMWAAFALEFIRQLSKNLTFSKYLIAEYKLFKSRIYASNKQYDILKIKVNAIIIFGYIILLIIGYVTGIYKNFAWINSLPTLLMAISFLFISSPIYIPILSVVPNLKKLLGNSVSDLKKCIKKPDYENRTTFIEEFHEDFKNIVECYAPGEKVFVFIEDLDRCEVPKAADLMQALNLMISNDPHLIFIIGMDRFKVASGFAVKYEKLLPYLQSSKENSKKENSKKFSLQNGDYYKGLEYGYEFLEKFIQISFLVPQPGIKELQNLLKNEDEENTVGNNQSKTLWIKVNEGIKDSYGKIKYKYIKKYKIKSKKENPIQPPPIDPYDKDIEVDPKKQQTLIELLKIKVDPKSETIDEIIKMVSPALDYNPRRIKQFINLFRLKAFIAGETGLFCREKGSHNAYLTLEKLGKIVAITLKWPLILSHLNLNNKLLDELQKISLEGPDKVENISDEARYWIVQEKLIDLFRYGCLNSEDNSINQKNEKIFSLSNLDINKLLQTSKQLDRNTILPPSGELNEDTKQIINKIINTSNNFSSKVKGTYLEETAANIRNEVLKWENVNEKNISFKIHNLILVIKSNLPSKLDNHIIFEEIERIEGQKDVKNKLKNICELIELMSHINFSETKFSDTELTLQEAHHWLNDKLRSLQGDDYVKAVSFLLNKSGEWSNDSALSRSDSIYGFPVANKCKFVRHIIITDRKKLVEWFNDKEDNVVKKYMLKQFNNTRLNFIFVDINMLELRYPELLSAVYDGVIVMKFNNEKVAVIYKFKNLYKSEELYKVEITYNDNKIKYIENVFDQIFQILPQEQIIIDLNNLSKE